MTSIRTLAFSHTIGYIILLSIMTIVTRWLWIYPQQQQLAMEYQERELTSIQNAIHTFHNNLSYLALGYSTTPEVQNLVQTPNTTNLRMAKDELDLVLYELEYFVLTDDKNNVLIGLYRSDDNTETYELTEKDKEAFTARLNKTSNDETIENFELFKGQPVMAATYPVYNNSEQPLVIGRLLMSWTLYGSSLQQISDIVQINLKPSSADEIKNSNKIDLFQTGFEDIEESHIRCLYDNDQTLVNCLTIHHDKQLIPKFLTFTILARILAFSLVPLIFFIIMLNYLIRPLEQTTRFLKKTSSKKGIIHLTEEAPIFELEEMRIAFNELVDATHLQKSQLEQQSLTDSLTQIPNRRAFDSEIRKTQNRLQNSNNSAAIIICDIDYFKLFNDHYGHLHGDEILKKVATTLYKYGSRNDEICARYGGEEFAIILSNVQPHELEAVLKSIINHINLLKEPHTQSPYSRLTLSCGAIYIDTLFTAGDKNLTQQWVAEADKALYRAKERGRNRYEISVFENTSK